MESKVRKLCITQGFTLRRVKLKKKTACCVGGNVKAPGWWLAIPTLQSKAANTAHCQSHQQLELLTSHNKKRGENSPQPRVSPTQHLSISVKSNIILKKLSSTQSCYRWDLITTAPRFLQTVHEHKQHHSWQCTSIRSLTWHFEMCARTMQDQSFHFQRECNFGVQRSVITTDHFTCTSDNLIYCINCIGETGRRRDDRFR